MFYLWISGLQIQWATLWMHLTVSSQTAQRIPKTVTKLSRLELYKACCLSFPICKIRKQFLLIHRAIKWDECRRKQTERVPSTQAIYNTEILNNLGWNSVFHQMLVPNFLEVLSQRSKQSDTSVTGSRTQRPRVISSLDWWFTVALPLGS